MWSVLTHGVLLAVGNVHVVEEEILSYYRLGSSQETLQHKQDVSS